MIDAEIARQAAIVLLASWPLHSVADGALHEAGDQLMQRVFARLRYQPEGPPPGLDDLVNQLTLLSRADPSLEADLRQLIGIPPGISSQVGEARDIYNTNITAPITTVHIGPERGD